MMMTFDYNYQNSFHFCFLILLLICQSHCGLKNNNPLANLPKKTLTGLT